MGIRGLNESSSTNAAIAGLAGSLSSIQGSLTQWDADIPEPDGLLIPATARLPRWQTAATVITLAQSGHGWGGSGTFTANDTTDYVLGSQSMKMVTTGTGATFSLSRNSLAADTTGKQVRIRLKVTNVVNTFVKVEYGTDSTYNNRYEWTLAAQNTTKYELLTENEWVTFVLNFGSATVVGAPTRSTLTSFRLRVTDASGQPSTCNLQSVELVDEPATTFPNGVVSICFDDGFGSSFTRGKAYLDTKGYRASHFLIDDVIGASGKITTAQIDQMQAQGHEVCAHSLTLANHAASFPNLTAAELDADLRAQVARNRARGWRGTGTAYPKGKFGFTSDNVATQGYMARYFSYARTTNARTMETFPPVEPYRLRAASGISTFAGGTTPTSITTATTGLIDQAKTNKAWLILVFHDITTTTPAATTECLEADFQAIVDKVQSSGIACLPIADVLAS